MYTRNGHEVVDLKFDKERNTYSGFVNGKPMTWLSNGRRASQRTSKFDLVDSLTFYVNIIKWGNRLKIFPKVYTNQLTAKVSQPRGYVKTIEFSI